jgi:hypothetical protein
MTFTDNLIVGLIIAAFSTIPLAIIMMFATQVYINRSSRRERLLELGYGNPNPWSNGKKVDFFTANYMISHMVFAAWMMRKGWVHKRTMKNGAIMVSHIHLNKNYEKLFDEFPFFVKLEFTKMALLLIGLSAMFIGYGTAHDWW